MLGAQSVNPNIKVKIIWVNTWFDPGKEADAAKALLEQGADILVQHTDARPPLQEAEKAGKLGFGQASDMNRFAPKAQLTAIVDDWSPYYIERAKAVLDGTWKSDRHLARHRRRDGRDGALHQHAGRREGDGRGNRGRHQGRHDPPFACPVDDQNGKTVECKGGETLDDGQILSMNWYVKGMDDKIQGK